MKLDQVRIFDQGTPLTTNARKKTWLKQHGFKVANGVVSYTFTSGPTRKKTVDPVRIQSRIDEAIFQQAADAREWLTYETIFNAEQFRQTNQRLSLGLYQIPIKYLDVNLVSNPPPHLVEVLETFFPCITEDRNFDIAEYAQGAYSEPQKQAALALMQQFQAPAIAGRGRNVVSQGIHYAVLPYNYHHNGSKSPAIGTKLYEDFGIKRLTAEWPMWNTASRSKIAIVPPRQARSQPHQKGDVTERDAYWPHSIPFDSKKRSDEPGLANKYTGTGNEGDHFQFATAPDTTFSIKTGVEYIGASYQGGAKGKDILEKNCHVSRMRSDYMIAQDELLEPDPELAVQQELLSITFKELPGYEPGDGISIRDLSCMDRGKLYFPPLSIPNAGHIFVSKYNEMHSATETFETFWGRCYASLLGRAKAKLLLRYGLQFTTPNPQNFLLEFESDLRPTGRLIVRDVGDANLHVEVIRALHDYGPRGSFAIPELDREYDLTANLGHRPYDTNTDKKGDKSFYPKGTQFHWHNYSVFKGQYLDEVGSANCTAPAMIAWGRLHDDAYVKYLNDSLNSTVEFDKEYSGKPPGTLAEALDQERDRIGEVHTTLVSAEGVAAIQTFRGTLLK